MITLRHGHAALALLAALAACHVGGDSPAGPDAAAIGPGPDGGGAGGPDAAPPGPQVDAGVPCSVQGVPGVCLDVADCDGVSTPGLCPGPAAIQCCTPPDGAVCDPEAMPLPNEGLSEAPGVGGCPAGMIPIDDFCIDEYEASLERVGGGTWSPFFNPGDTPVRARSIAGAVPQGYITGLQAGAACTAAGKRLCTDTEWLRACRGPDDFIYPYGNDRMDGVCNDARAVHPAVEYFGSSDPSVFSMLDHPCLNQLPDSLDLAGGNPGCVTADGAFDMMGNLHEWTADPAGTFRGGFYVDTRVNGDGCLYRTIAHDTDYSDYSTGFRCCF